MPSYVLRVDKEEPPMYVMWSSIVDDITGAGTREEVKRQFAHRPDEVADERFDRADQTGTSDQYPDVSLREGPWEDKGFVCQQKWLPRSALRGYAQARIDGKDGQEFLEVIED